MGKSRYLPASDGYLARVSGLWAEEKLEYLSEYMYVFSTGMKNLFSERIYLDLMAGPGRCISESGSYEFDGSPLLALKVRDPFTKIVLVEEHPKLAEALSHRVGDKADVCPENCNDPATIERLRAAVSGNALGLAFADNLGLNVEFSTLCNLTRGKRIDLFITFQIGDLKRNRDAASIGEDDARWTAFFGTDRWREVITKCRAENVSAEDTATRLLDLYAEQLGSIGYGYVGHGRRVMKNSRNVGMYRVLLAGKHQRAQDLFDKISRIQPGGQRDLLA